MHILPWCRDLLTKPGNPRKKDNFEVKETIAVSLESIIPLDMQSGTVSLNPWLQPLV